MRLFNIYKDSAFSNAVIPSGTQLVYVGYNNGISGTTGIKTISIDSDGNQVIKPIVDLSLISSLISGKMDKVDPSGNGVFTFNGQFNHGMNCIVQGMYGEVAGLQTTAAGDASHAEGGYTKANGTASHAEGAYTQAIGTLSHAEGLSSIAGINYDDNLAAHAEGARTQALGKYSHAEGQDTIVYVDSDSSHAEGYETTVSGDYSHTEGYQTIVNGDHSHAEGDNVVVNGQGSHAEGYSTVVNGNYSHAEGDNTVTNSAGSHAEGYNTITSGDYQHVEGQWNIPLEGYQKIVGGGQDDQNRKNIHTLDWNGNAYFAGQISGSDFTTSNGISLSQVASGATTIANLIEIHDGDTVNPDYHYKLTMTANTTINASALDTDQVGAGQIFINPGIYTLSAGTNLKLMNALTASKLNYCTLNWYGSNCYLYVIDSLS